MRGHDYEFIETVMQFILAFAALMVLEACLRMNNMSAEANKEHVHPLLLCSPLLLFSPFFFLALERRFHEKAGRCLRYFHAVASFVGLTMCSIYLICIAIYWHVVFLLQLWNRGA